MVSGDDELVDVAGVLLDVGDDILQQLARRNPVEAVLGIRKEVRVGELDDARQGHLVASLHERTGRPQRTTPPGRAPVGTPSRRAATPFTQTPATPSGDRVGSA